MRVRRAPALVLEASCPPQKPPLSASPQPGPAPSMGRSFCPPVALEHFFEDTRCAGGRRATIQGGDIPRHGDRGGPSTAAWVRPGR